MSNSAVMPLAKNTPLRTVKEMGEECGMCGHCCGYGAGMLVKEDVPKIAKYIGISEEKLKERYLDEVEMFNTKTWRPKVLKGKKPYGPCIFYDRKTGCSIHIVKPLQCLITNCNPNAEQAIQWLYLNYFVNANDPESIRQWASYLNQKEWVIEGGNLRDLVPDEKTLKKILSYGDLKK